MNKDTKEAWTEPWMWGIFQRHEGGGSGWYIIFLRHEVNLNWQRTRSSDGYYNEILHYRRCEGDQVDTPKKT